MVGEHAHVFSQHPPVEGFVGVVQFEQDIVGVLVHDAVEVGVARPIEALLGQARQFAYHVEVGLHGDIDVGALHLDHDFSAGGERGAMHLGG
jgi:hypothetical protein